MQRRWRRPCLTGVILKRTAPVLRRYITEIFFTVPEQYRVVPFAREPDFLDRKVERSMELALDLDSFFRSHDKEYGEKYSAVDVPEHFIRLPFRKQP